ncbi:MAG: 50S ribosomal protein L21 [Elusimicrobiota bacterium]|nr:50S ribosomal protein L21 [Elusimicrobiota bacterium]
MYAVAEIGGKQYILTAGDKVIVEKLKLDKGNEYVIDKVLLVKHEDGKIEIGRPYLDNVKILAEVSEHIKSKKVIVLRKGNPKKNWRRKYGHRQQLTILKVKEIQV